MRDLLPLLTAAVFSAAIAFPSSGAEAEARLTDTKLALTGVNMAGAEFGTTMPGAPGTDYFYPKREWIDHFADKGVNVFRLPFRWERLQPKLGAELAKGEVERIDEVVNYVTSAGLAVILDPHNYARYQGKLLGTPQLPTWFLADLWARIASRYAMNDRVIFGLMNEPSRIATEIWLEAANAAIAAIRQTGAKNLILVPGSGWSGAHSWSSHSYGTPNAKVMLGIEDSQRNYVFEVHQYLDSDSSGTSAECLDATVGSRRLAGFTHWAREHQKRAFLGEFGAGADPVCMAALEDMLTFMEQNADVWLGWTYWAAGPWNPTYFTSLQPQGGSDRPQMAVLTKHFTDVRDTQ